MKSGFILVYFSKRVKQYGDYTIIYIFSILSTEPPYQREI